MLVSYLGWGYKATKTLQQMLSVYSDELDLWNQLGIQYLIIGRNEDARQTFLKVYSVHYYVNTHLVHGNMKQPQILRIELWTTKNHI